MPGVKEEKERILREQEEQRKKLERQQAAYNDACAKVIAQIDEDSASVTATIEEEFAPKLRGIQREIDEAMSEGNRQREAIQRQISELRNQQASLGFFKRKEKKALQIQIDEAQSRMNSIASSADIQSRYQPQIAQITAEKQAAIEKAITEVKSKYTMPKLEDFSEV